MSSWKVLPLAFCCNLLAAWPAAAQPQPPAAPTTDRLADDRQRHEQTPDPNPSQPPARDRAYDSLEAHRTTETLTESEAVQRALKQNPTLRAAQLRLARSKQEVLVEEGRYPYFLDANAGVSRDETAQLLRNDTLLSASRNGIGGGLGLRRLFPFGTQAQIRADGDYFDVDDDLPTAAMSPLATRGYNATLSASLVQPLLRGFGRRVGEADLRAARVGREAARRALERIRSALIADVRIAYSELWLAIRVVEIERDSLQHAKDQIQQARTRLELGAVSTVDLLTFETRVAERAEALSAAQEVRAARSIQLDLLLGSSPSSETLRASSKPNLESVALEPSSVEAATRAHSVELAELNQQVKLARIQAEVAGESARPRLDLEGGILSGGTSTELGTAWRRSAEASWWTAQAGLVLELPLDQQARHASEVQAQLAVRSAQAELRAARDRVAADARTAIARARAADAQLAHARRTTEIAASAYQAERDRYALGASIVIQLHDAEDSLRRARLREASAMVAAIQARILLLHLTGRLQHPGQLSSG